MRVPPRNWQCRVCNQVFAPTIPIASRSLSWVSPVRTYYHFDVGDIYCDACLEGFRQNMWDNLARLDPADPDVAHFRRLAQLAGESCPLTESGP